MSQPNMQPAARPPAVSAPAGAGDPGHVQQYLAFVLNGEVFAIGILAIKEIIEYTHPTAVPMSPEYVRGVLNLRGAVVPVIDLSVRFGKQASPVTRRTCVVIAELEAGAERHVIGVIVDAVNAVLDIPATDIEPPPSFGMHIRAELLRGMGKVGGRFVILLDVNRMLAADELVALSDSHESATV